MLEDVCVRALSVFVCERWGGAMRAEKTECFTVQTEIKTDGRVVVTTAANLVHETPR